MATTRTLTVFGTGFAYPAHLLAFHLRVWRRKNIGDQLFEKVCVHVEKQSPVVPKGICIFFDCIARIYLIQFLELILLLQHHLCTICFEARSDRPRFPLTLRWTRIIFFFFKQLSHSFGTKAEDALHPHLCLMAMILDYMSWQ
jgi:hypothetical protein